MKDSCCSFFSVNVRCRPAQKVSGRSNRPRGFTGVTTVIAVALPSTLATDGRDRLRGARRLQRDRPLWSVCRPHAMRFRQNAIISVMRLLIIGGIDPGTAEVERER